MDKYYNLLKSIDLNEVKKEIDESRIKRIFTINEILAPVYKLDDRKATSHILLKSLEKTLSKFKENKKNLEKLKNILIELDKILRILFFIGDRASDKLNMVITPFRKVLREVLKDGKENDFYKDTFDFFGLTRKERLDRRIDYQKSIKHRNETRGELRPIYIEDVLNWMDNLKSIKNTENNVLDKIILLLLASGSRFIELMDKSTYEKVNEEDTIKISNIAKKYKESESQRKLLHMTADEFLTTLHMIRNVYETKKARTSPALLAKLNERFRILFSRISNPIDEICDITLRYTRVIYANMNYKIFAEPHQIPYESYIQEQLGHKDPTSTKSYLCINLQWKNPSIVNDNKPIKKRRKKNIVSGSSVSTKSLTSIVDDLIQLDKERVKWKRADIPKLFHIGSDKLPLIIKLYKERKGL